jgi:hypothetical protein
VLNVSSFILIGTEKKYTFNIKDELLPPNPDNGREQSTISYEYDFDFLSDSGSPVGNMEATPESLVGTVLANPYIIIPWREFKATYRGKEKKDAPALDTKSIKRFGIMMRRFKQFYFLPSTRSSRA